MNKNNGKCLNCGIDVTGKSLTCSIKCRVAVSRAKKIAKIAKSVTSVTSTVTESVTKPTSVTKENVTLPKVINDPKTIVEKAKELKKKNGEMPEYSVPLFRDMNKFYKSKISWGGVTKNGIITYELPDGSKEHFRIR